jgi:hypothetical protein
MSTFIYSDDLPTPTAGAFTTLAEIGHVSGKDQLLDLIATQLSFPDYFGRNWDALDECIKDLSWLGEGDVAILHREIPASLGREGLRTYLKLLRDAALTWRHRGTRTLATVFPLTARRTVEASLSDGLR